MSDILSPIVRIIIDTEVSSDLEFYNQIVAAGIAKLNYPSSVITLRSLAGDTSDTDVLVYDEAYRSSMDLSDEAIIAKLNDTHYALLIDQSSEAVSDLCRRVRYEALSFYSAHPEQDPPILAPTPTSLLSFAKNNIGVRYSAFGYDDVDNVHTYFDNVTTFMSMYISHLIYTHLSNIIDTRIITESWDAALSLPTASYYVSFPIPVSMATWDALATRIRDSRNILYVTYPGAVGHEVTPVTFQKVARVEFPKTWQNNATSDISVLTGVPSTYKRVQKREVVCVDTLDQAVTIVQLALGINPMD